MSMYALRFIQVDCSCTHNDAEREENGNNVWACCEKDRCKFHHAVGYAFLSGFFWGALWWLQPVVWQLLMRRHETRAQHKTLLQLHSSKCALFSSLPIELFLSGMLWDTEKISSQQHSPATIAAGPTAEAWGQHADRRFPVVPLHGVLDPDVARHQLVDVVRPRPAVQWQPRVGVRRLCGGGLVLPTPIGLASTGKHAA